MRRAATLALKARGATSPNPLVGALIVKNNCVIAEGWHKRAGEDHAEIAALKKAGRSAKGAELYVTLEPCFHYGRTPPCVDAVIASGIKKVMIGMKDPNPLTNGKSIAKLKRAGLKVKVGILQDELIQMNEAFFKYIKSRRPFVATKTAQTLDGKIATRTGRSKWITAERTREFARKVRDQFDGIVVGVNTVLQDDPHLYTTRKINPVRKIVLDSRLRAPLKARLFKRNTSACLIATTKKASSGKIKSFRDKGVLVIVAPAKEGKVDLKWLLKELARMEMTNILVEGGAETVGSFLKEGVVDKMYFYIAPKVMGDDSGRNAIVGLKTVRIDQTIQLKNWSVEKIGQDILISAYVHRDR